MNSIPSSDRLPDLATRADDTVDDLVARLDQAGLIPHTVALWLAVHTGLVALAVAGLWLAPKAWRAVRGRYTRRDPVRAFTAVDVAAARGLAGQRCEFTAMFGRCRRPGAHADHWVPWTRGGASALANLVWACARHNLRKGAKPPGVFATWRVHRRRLRYYPPGQPTRPGARYKAVTAR